MSRTIPRCQVDSTTWLLRDLGLATRPGVRRVCRVRTRPRLVAGDRERLRLVPDPGVGEGAEAGEPVEVEALPDRDDLHVSLELCGLDQRAVLDRSHVRLRNGG